jgi:FMN phosphatase YigB (HAD superfamily)
MPRIFSSDLGLTKPDPRLFHQAASLLGAAVGEILLVDDSPANTDAAAALGFRVHRYQACSQEHACCWSACQTWRRPVHRP